MSDYPVSGTTPHHLGWLAWIALFLTAKSMASSSPLHEAVGIIHGHPQVLIAQANALRFEADVAAARAPRFPSVVFGTEGGRRLFGNRGDGQARATGSNEYTDGMLTARQRLFDFGATGRRIAAAEFDAMAEGLSVDTTINGLMLELLTQVNHDRQAVAQIALINDTRDALFGQLALARARFESGVSNGDNVRGLTVDLARLEADAQRWRERRRESQLTLLEKLGLSLQQASAVAQAIETSPVSEAAQTLGQQQLEAKAQAAQLRFQAAKSDALPAIDLELKTRFFDLDQHGFSRYEGLINLEFDIPVLDGGARKARQQAARFTADALREEAAFQRRIDQARLAQIDAELLTQQASLANLAVQLQQQTDGLAEERARQGSTQVGIAPVVASVNRLHSIRSTAIDVDSRLRSLGFERRAINQTLASDFTRLLADIEVAQ